MIKLTVKQAAQYLNISISTLKRWDKIGKLVPERHPLTRYRYYNIWELDKFVESYTALKVVHTRVYNPK